MNTPENQEPICDTCGIWRDYRDDIDEHPDYDGHCWLRGIMTLNEQECKLRVTYENAG